jgi:hypothetical protein
MVGGAGCVSFSVEIALRSSGIAFASKPKATLSGGKPLKAALTRRDFIRL